VNQKGIWTSNEIASKEVGRLDRYIVVLAGAGLGGLARYALGTWIMVKYGGRFPLGTFIINITGAFLIGVLMPLLTSRSEPHPNWRLFLVVGVLGGYTTFSSFEYETLQAVQDGERWMGLLYVAGSVLLGYLAVWLGAALTARR
jgi:CrcB protein